MDSSCVSDPVKCNTHNQKRTQLAIAQRVPCSDLQDYQNGHCSSCTVGCKWHENEYLQEIRGKLQLAGRKISLFCSLQELPNGTENAKS